MRFGKNADPVRSLRRMWHRELRGSLTIFQKNSCRFPAYLMIRRPRRPPVSYTCMAYALRLMIMKDPYVFEGKDMLFLRSAKIAAGFLRAITAYSRTRPLWPRRIR